MANKILQELRLMMRAKDLPFSHQHSPRSS
jgi:hypothetical protein